jgi:hypothetical protein
MPNWHPATLFALGIPCLTGNRLWKISLRCHLPLRATWAFQFLDIHRWV